MTSNNSATMRVYCCSLMLIVVLMSLVRPHSMPRWLDVENISPVSLSAVGFLILCVLYLAQRSRVHPSIKLLPVPVREYTVYAAYFDYMSFAARTRLDLWARENGCDERAWRHVQRMGKRSWFNISYQGCLWCMFYALFIFPTLSSVYRLVT